MVTWKNRFNLKLRRFLIICRHQNSCLYERKFLFIFNKANLTLSKLPGNEILLILRHMLKKRVNSSLEVNVLTSKAKIFKNIKKYLNCLFLMANSPLRHFWHFLFFTRGLLTRWLPRRISKEAKNGLVKKQIQLEIKAFSDHLQISKFMLIWKKIIFHFQQS